LQRFERISCVFSFNLSVFNTYS